MRSSRHGATGDRHSAMRTQQQQQRGNDDDDKPHDLRRMAPDPRRAWTRAMLERDIVVAVHHLLCHALQPAVGAHHARVGRARAQRRRHGAVRDLPVRREVALARKARNMHRYHVRDPFVRRISLQRLAAHRDHACTARRRRRWRHRVCQPDAGAPTAAASGRKQQRRVLLRRRCDGLRCRRHDRTPQKAGVVMAAGSLLPARRVACALLWPLRRPLLLQAAQLPLALLEAVVTVLVLSVGATRQLVEVPWETHGLALRSRTVFAQRAGHTRPWRHVRHGGSMPGTALVNAAAVTQRAAQRRGTAMREHLQLVRRSACEALTRVNRAVRDDDRSVGTVGEPIEPPRRAAHAERVAKRVAEVAAVEVKLVVAAALPLAVQRLEQVLELPVAHGHSAERCRHAEVEAWVLTWLYSMHACAGL
mmetsp:Transcript_30783/g.91528  ORF Transcript_30783/g.91528 Transcript_30783/m.91528 type:complete len:420 (-) Transcript_30783:1213-2472(-)